MRNRRRSNHRPRNDGTARQQEPAVAGAERPVVALGPELPGIGSWDWVGADLADELPDRFEVTTFEERIPDCDVAVIVKYKPPLDAVLEAAQRCAVIFCPIDGYGSAADVDADYALLRNCTRIVLHAPTLAKYFQSYAPVVPLDHHVKFTTPLPAARVDEGPILWTGMRNNLPPLVDWVNAHRLPSELLVLTNLEEDEHPSTAEAFGFDGPTPVRIEAWSDERHRTALATARGAIDVKGDDFRQRHKPPAKALDSVASGVPLAMNADSSSAAYLRGMGFDVAEPDDTDRWLSQAYWEQTQRFGRAVSELLSRERIGRRLQQIIEEVIEERVPC